RKPRWLKEKLELWFEGAIIRRIRNAVRAKNVVAILAAFEESGWPSQIYDPITGGGDSSTRRRVVETLNKDLKRIRFSCAGDGESFRWEIRSGRSRPKTATRREGKKAATRGARPAAGKRAAKKARRKPS
ncbi:MAG: hypothetical protein ACKO6B_01720, partial [Planctomycetia bacterium]